MPHNTVTDHPGIDVLVVPGGVHMSELEKPAVIDWIARQAANAVSLYLVSRLADPTLAQRTARQMDYPWTGTST